jgi:hypothetical protein
MLDNATLRWAACAGLPTGETCKLQWSDLCVVVGLFLVVDAAISFSLRWGRSLQAIQTRSLTPTSRADPKQVSLYPEYPDDDCVVTSDDRTAA